MHHAPRDPRGLVLATLASVAVAAGIAAIVVILPAGASTGYDYPAEPTVAASSTAAPADPSTAVPAAGATAPAGTARDSASTGYTGASTGSTGASAGSTGASTGSSTGSTGASAGDPTGASSGTSTGAATTGAASNGVLAEPPAPKPTGGTVQPPAAAGAAQADTLRSTRVATRGRGRLMAATLTGDVEAPAMGDPHGVGVAAVRVEAGKLCLEATVTGLAPLTKAHLHRGVRGTAGPVVAEFPLVGPARVAAPASPGGRLRAGPAGR